VIEGTTSMGRQAGNRKLKAARLAAGFGSQQALADALNAGAQVSGLRGIGVGARQVRRWESAEPPWPQMHHQRLLSQVLGLPVDQLGFTPPWDSSGVADSGTVGVTPVRAATGRQRRRGAAGVTHPSTVPAGIAAITVVLRRLYWTVDPLHLHPAVVQHVRLGKALLTELEDPGRGEVAAAIAESGLLAGRIEFFDLAQPEAAAESFVRALQAAGEAGDSLLGAAILAHAAFVPGWAGDRAGAEDRLAAARAHARRGRGGPLLLAWLDAVDAECATRCGDPKAALATIDLAESRLRDDPDRSLPEWLDWFTPIRLAAFKGNTQLRAGQTGRARNTLTEALDELPPLDSKQRAVILADLAAVEIAAENPTEACTHLGRALDKLEQTWYATAMARIRDVRRALRPWQHEQCVRDLDDRLYGWETTLTAVRS
jgi:tetratricopeptide (TPR) repeat protein